MHLFICTNLFEIANIYLLNVYKYFYDVHKYPLKQLLNSKSSLFQTEFSILQLIFKAVFQLWYLKNPIRGKYLLTSERSPLEAPFFLMLERDLCFPWKLHHLFSLPSPQPAEQNANSGGFSSIKMIYNPLKSLGRFDNYNINDFSIVHRISGWKMPAPFSFFTWDP